MLWQPIGEQELLKALRQSKQTNREGTNEEIRLAIDYMEGRQRADIEEQLVHRYPTSQSGDSGQMIFPVTIPLVERYVSEAANAYNKPVTRGLVDPDGEETDATQEVTDAVNKHLGLVGYDERLHLNEKLSVLTGVSSVWYQVKRGMLRPVVTAPDDIYPLAHADGVLPDGVAADPKDPDDYAGFIVELAHAVDDSSMIARRQFALVTSAETIFYSGHGPYSPDTSTLQKYPNPFAWDMLVDKGKTQRLPLQMLTFWHRSMPTRTLIGGADADIVYANREINIQLSMLFDTIRLQGWATPVLNKMNKGQESKVVYGARFPIELAVGETMSMVTGNAPYSQIIETLKTTVQLLAMSKRQSSNDFSIDGAAPASGFAKLVDSLPKLEAREERIRRLKHMEENVAWPRICSALIWLGVIPESARNLQMRVEFADVEFPRSVDETARLQEHEFRFGLDSPTEFIMRRDGISREAAEAQLEQNRKDSKSAAPPPPGQGAPGQPAQPNDTRSVFASLIGRTAQQPQQPQQPPQAEEEDET